MQEEETRLEEMSVREPYPHEDPSPRRRHRRPKHEPRHRSRHRRHGERRPPEEAVWDRYHWLFLVVLTNLISLTMGIYVGHRHWSDLKNWLGLSEHPKASQTLELRNGLIQEGS